MRILWITNLVLPDACKALGRTPHRGGGWMHGLAMQLKENKEIQLTIISFFDDEQESKFKINNISYYLLPHSLLNDIKKLNNRYQQITLELEPDLVHIHGTELNYGYIYIESCPNIKSLISIQGMVSVCSKYFFTGLTNFEIISNLKLSEIYRKGSMYHQYRSFVKRSSIERKYIQKVDFVVGRTTWDHAHSFNLNKNVNYRISGEILREAFYSASKWNRNKIKKHTIFISQAGYPIKGFHMLLRAVALLSDEYPDLTVRIAGERFPQKLSLSNRFGFSGSGYGSFIVKLINRLKINVEFLGVLNETEMIREYQNAHVFVCPSSIENSPNSIGEAQMIGTPVIASYVGGVPDMIVHEETGHLYRFEEVEMLAFYIKKIFEDDELAMELSANGIMAAEKRHSKEIITKQVLNIYDELINGI